MRPAPTSHFLLFAEARIDCDQWAWQFVLSRVGSDKSLTAGDVELDACRERLELLALVRGLEAIGQAARVTLVTNSRYVARGLRHGLADWRANDWVWERFGQFVPVRDCDLWRRVDRALEYHELDCRMWRFAAHVEPHASRLEYDGCDQPAAPIVNRRRSIRPPAEWSAPGVVAVQPAELAAG